MKHLSLIRPKRFCAEHKAILIVMGLLFIERILALCFLGLNYSLQSDDWDYIISGIVFANTGTVTMHGPVSAQIMPGMPYFTGLLSLLFGEGRLYLLALKLSWSLMGCLTAYFLYRNVTLFAPKWCGIVAALPLFAPNYVWLDNLILTETPFILCSAATIYFTLQMGRTKQLRYFWGCAIFYLCMVLLKANAVIYPFFAAIYLLSVRYGVARLLKHGLLLGCMMLVFFVPWTIRNYQLFHSFVPLTYGAGNPLLLGSYQGEKAPADEELDYETNVNDVFREQYADYYNEDGTVKEAYYPRYLSLQKDGIKARYRMREWFKKDSADFLQAYLVDKPAIMINNIYYSKTLYGTQNPTLTTLRYFSYLLAIGSFVLAFLMKKHRRVMLFLAALYVSSIYVYALNFAYSRYGQTLVHIWYIMIGIGLGLLAEAIVRCIRRLKLPSAKDPS